MADYEYSGNLDADLKAFAGQKRLAELLYQQNLKTPQGGMVGNIYVGASPWEFLGNLANQYVADKEIKDIEQNELKAAKADKLASLLAMQEANQTEMGSPAIPATPEQYKMLEGQIAPRDDEGNLMPGTQYQAAQAGREAIAPNQQAAIQRLLKGGKESQAYAWERMKEKPNWEVVKQTVNGIDQQQLMNKSSRAPLTTLMNYGEGTPNVAIQQMWDKGIGVNTRPNQMGVNPNQSADFGQMNNGDMRLKMIGGVENPKGENITNPKGTAHGLYQITKETVEDTINKTPELKGITYQQFQQDTGLQKKVAEARLKINDADLAKNGVPIDPVTSQARWFTGNAGLAKAINDEAAQGMKVAQFMTPKQIADNPEEAAKTVGKYRNDVAKKIMAAVGQDQQQSPQQDKYRVIRPDFGANKEAARNFDTEAKQPLTGDAYKAVSGSLGVIDASDRYINTLNTYTRQQIMANPEISAFMQADSKRLAMMQQKAFELGVLNKEDLPQINAVVRDPTNINNILLAKDALIKMAKMNQFAQTDQIVNQYQMSQKDVPEYLKQRLTKLDTEKESFERNAKESLSKRNPSATALQNQGKDTKTAARIPRYNPATKQWD